MKKSTFKEKLLLIIFGVLLAAILLEISLRMAGIIVLYLQERHNHVSFHQNEYRILCLGESTTALGGEDSYPSQLEAMLNAQSRKRQFTVINKGIISTTTSHILAHVDQNLDIYKPQLVIIMMGINDKAYLHNPYKTLWWENIKADLKDFRVYKLVHLLYEHITHRIKEANAPGPKVDLSGNDKGDYQHIESFLKLLIAKSIQGLSQHMSASAQYRQKGQLAQARQERQLARQSLVQAGLLCVELAQRYRLQNSFQEAEGALKQAAIFTPDLPDLYQEWGELYLAQDKADGALKAFQTALALDPENSEVLQSLARAYHQKHSDEAFLVYARYLQIKPKDYWGYIELAQWLRENKHYELAQEYLSHAIEIGPAFARAYIDLGQILNGQGKRDLAKEYFQKAALHQMSEYYPVTLVNYSLLLNKILSRHIKVIVMQYPLEDISALKDYLGQRKGVIYVENNQNFRKALVQGGFWRYFKDNFAYDFGHCTRKGNELIAQNLAEVILKNE